MPSLPPERPSETRHPRASNLGTAKTEQLASAERDAPDPNATPTAELQLPQRKGWPAVAMAVGTVVVAAAIGIAVLSSGDQPVEPITPETSQAPEPDDGADTAEEAGPVVDTPTEPPRGIDPPAVAEPARVSVQLTSVPEGAAVRLGDVSLGTTPLVAPLPPSDEAVELRFEKNGYLPQTLSVLVVEGVEVPAVRLRRRRRAASSNETGTPLPIKTGL